MNGTIIFKITIANVYGGFALASNFISKVHNHEEIKATEVSGISSLFCKDIETMDNKSIVESIICYQDRFKEIGRPENLMENLENYEVIFCLWIREDISDIVELQYDSLIKQFFKGKKIISILSGRRSFYFKSSHYLYDISNSYSQLYNSTFFIEEGLEKKAIRLQKNNVGGLTHFMPVHLFGENRNILFDSLEKYIIEEDLAAVLLGDIVDLKKYSPMLHGCLNLLKESHYLFQDKNVSLIVKLLYSGNVLSFLLFAYSIKALDEENVAASTIELYFYRMKEYAMGCEQLVENVIHHSMTGCGAISIRLHERETQYLTTRYGLDKKNTPHLEVLITDYAGINTSGNIADNFRLHLDEETKIDFEYLLPINFLIKEAEIGSECVKRAFIKYYKNFEHIGKHIGLKVFRSIVERYKGIFGFYSHRSHILNEGENYRFLELESVNSGIQCIPGTGYTILFPLHKMVQDITRAEIGIDDNIHLEDNIEYFINGYKCVNDKLESNMFTFSNQKEKENMIYLLSQRFNKNRFDIENKSKIIYISAKGLNDEYAEYIAKSLLMAGNDNSIPDYVFYDCSKGFEKTFQNTMRIYYGMKDLAYLYKEKEFTIALYTERPIESSFFIPGNIYKTIWVNRKNSYAGVGLSGAEWIPLHMDNEKNIKNGGTDIPPYDILCGLDETYEGRTIFEQYTLQVLNTDIQESSFGCKISNTHMRLGSTIHIDNFYEAELLFNNRLFASRFAYLLVKKMYDEEELKELDHITLYSYALYSENLIVEIINLLEKLYPQKDVDYAILEREAEHRDFTHIDRIRYSTSFNSKSEQQEYFKNRKLVCIVPINSTLKTHEKLINLFCEDNEGFQRRNIVSNYALILVGSEKENKYWTIDEKNRTFSKISLDIEPIPNYCVLVKVKYFEALGCELCFPKNPLDEVPIVEVNAASTIPNQSFGLHRNTPCREEFSYEIIRREEEKLFVLKDSLIYSHIQRGENHYLYYFKTDELFLKNKDSIIDWLTQISKEIEINQEEYHVLFCPAHFSNAGFLECINRIIFHGAALIIRVDVDKEYRSNILSKYSNLNSFIKLLSKDETRKHVIKVYYIDDSIITGRTFYRSKSLMSSIVEQYGEQENVVDVHIFEKIFVLLDRNSKQSRLQYINCWENNKNKQEQVLDSNFYAYRTLHISSMRNHGDSCVLCQLEREAQILYQTAATRKMAHYWKRTNEKFKVKLLRDKQEEIKRNKEGAVPSEKAYRRMFCSHIVAIALSENRHGNRKEDAISCLLQLLIVDYEGRKREFNQEMAFEYMLSYLKIVSRPFMVFDKAIKESAFDIQLILTESVLGNQDVRKIIAGTNKIYLKDSEESFVVLVENIIRKEFSISQRMDLLLLLMKQLTEMKSNYFIRSVNVEKIAKFASVSEINNLSSEKLYSQYLQQTKKILGVSSDTSKSAWFNHEMSMTEKIKEFPEWVFGKLILENTRAYYDGIDKLYKNIKLDDESINFLCTQRWYGPEYKHYEKFNHKLETNEHIREEEVFTFLKETFRLDKEEVPEREIDNLAKKSSEKEFKKYYDKNAKRHKKECQSQNIQNLKVIINNELEKAQYRDFNSILEDLGYRINEVDEDAVVSILAGVQLMALCDEQTKHTTDKGNIEEVCYKVACLIEKIIRAKEVKIILECPLECDVWEDDIRRKFNDMVKIHLGTNENIKYEELYLLEQEKKEYLEIASSAMKPEIIEGVSIRVAKQLINYRANQKQDDFYVNDIDGYAVWEMGTIEAKRDEKRKLLIYVEFYDPKDAKNWNLLRNLFSMYHMLNTSIFDVENMDYLFELILADKERLMYNLEKAHSHTATTVKSMQYEYAKDNEEEVVGSYRSFVLTLLSDLQVSQVYRKSLKVGYYCKDVFLYPRSCEEIFDVFFDDFPLIVVNQKPNETRCVGIHIKFPEHGIISDDEEMIHKKDKIMSYEGGSAGEEVFLLILALIMNAAGPNRGCREISNDGKDNILNIEVYITKTKDGYLRIANKSDEKKKDINKVKEELLFPPHKDKGISLWSVSRYIRGLVSVCINKLVKKTESRLLLIDEQEKKLEEIMALRNALESVFGDSFYVRAEVAKKSDGISYFYMDIPILEAKYKDII